jgi:hypothetical protein
MFKSVRRQDLDASAIIDEADGTVMDNPKFPPNSFRSGDASRQLADPSLPASFSLGD